MRSHDKMLRVSFGAKLCLKAGKRGVKGPTDPTRNGFGFGCAVVEHQARGKT
jgi:hypothetical protein